METGETLGNDLVTPTYIRIYRAGNGTSVPYYTATYVQLGTFPTQWEVGQTLAMFVLYIPTGQIATWNLVIPGGISTINIQDPAQTIPPDFSISVTIGDGSEFISMPMDFQHKSSLNQTLYYQSELGFVGDIIKIRLYNQFSSSLDSKPTKIWMGSTNLNDLTPGWIPATELTLVFDGYVDYPPGTNVLTIPLQTAYSYAGGNLVVMFNRPLDTVSYDPNDCFYGQTLGANRARNAFSDTEDIDPYNPGDAGTLTGQFAKTSFIIGPEVMITDLIGPVVIPMNTACLLDSLNNYFSSYPSILYYSVAGSQYITWNMSGSQSILLTPNQDWYGVEYITIRATTSMGFYAEQEVKVTVKQTSTTNEGFDYGGSTPADWSVTHTGTTTYPWQPCLVEGSDYAMKTMATTGGTANERLISPVYDLSAYEDIQVSFNTDFLHYGSGTGTFAYTLNNVTYVTIESFSVAASGLTTYSLPALDGKPSVRFRWTYFNSIANTGQANHWIVDDFQIYAQVSDNEPPVAITNLSIIDLSHTSVSLGWSPSSDLYFGCYEIYVSDDAQVTTTDRLWSASEDPALYNVNTVQTTIPLPDIAYYWVAIQAVDQSGNYSPLSEVVNFYIETIPPTLSEPLPGNQPEPSWQQVYSVTLGCTYSDVSAPDYTSLAYRIDYNLNGIYDVDEVWTNVPARSLASGRSRLDDEISVYITLPGDGIFAWELRIADVYGNMAYSGNQNLEGIDDDWIVRVDATAPAQMDNFFVQEVFDNSIQLTWDASSDLFFSGYLVYYSTLPEVGAEAELWDQADDPNLQNPGSGLVSTTVTGLIPSTRYYFLLEATDEIGWITQYPSVITGMTSSSAQPQAPQNLTLAVQGTILTLDWDDVTQDVLGNLIGISYYEVHVADQPYFECTNETLLETVETSQLMLDGAVEFADSLLFKVIAVSGAIRRERPQGD